ncbi:MAG: tyrosine-type recombinase/integrase [Flavobacteriales bacterium]|nr:tyrosine-type recombinase/integrase [Flavobacteriales bacterium]
MNELEQFINYLQLQRRYSSHTIIAYKNDILQLFEYTEKTYKTQSLTEITPQVIRSWLANLKDNKTSNQTITRKISSLKTFFKFLKKKRIVAISPLIKIIPPKKNKKLPVFLKLEETSQLFDSTLFPNDYLGHRDLMILELFYATGMRLSELTTLTFNSIDINNQQIKVIGKRNKERIIPLSNLMCKKITTYIEIRNNFFSDNNKELFLSQKGKKIYPKLVYRLVNSYLSTVTTNSKKSPHILRHTFATHMLNNGADVNTIKEILGHSNLTATQIYTHNTIEKLKNIYKQAHPKA